MDERIVASSGRLSEDIKQLVADSERIFLRLAETYPSFVREMSRSLDRSSTMLSQLGSGASMEDALRGIFSRMRSVIGDASIHFRAIQERDHDLLLSLNRGIETLGRLDAVIVRIKDDSVEMELISLNAMTVALKSGSAGKAFSVITEELKRLSTRTISVTEALTEDGKALLELFRRFQSEVENLERNQQALFGGLDGRISGAFDKLEVAVRDVGTGLNSLVETSRGVEPPVRRIMETVQVQDLVRQSLDHVLMALNEIGNIRPESADDYAFCGRLFELSAAMVVDVRGSLAEAAATFRAQVSAVESVVADGEHRRRRLLDNSFGVDDSGAASRVFTETFHALEEISAQVDAYVRTKHGIALNGGKLAASVEELEKRFRDFSKILSRFKTIDVASRIEVAKQSSLKSMEDTVSEMSVLTERIGTDVAEALLATRGFIEETKKTINDYASMAAGEQALFDRAELSLQGALRSVLSLKDTIKSGVGEFSLFTEDFIAILRNSSRELSSFDKAVASLDEVVEEIQAQAKEAEAQTRRLGGSDSDGGVHSGKFKEIIDRFTIYAHKQAAADIGGFNVEGGAELGEVTLF